MGRSKAPEPGLAGDAAFRGRLGGLLRTLGVDSRDSEWRPGMVYLASWTLGADESAIADRLGYPIREVRRVGTRLRRNGIWQGERVCIEESDDGKADPEGQSTVTVMLHILAAAGEVRRVEGE